MSPAVAAQSPGPACCAHCTLPVPETLILPGESRQFCCAGCRSVWTAIHEYGLERYYSLLDSDDAAEPARTTGGGYAWFDDPAFDERYVARSEDGRASIELQLEGLRCSACVWIVERLPRIRSGVIDAHVDFGRQTMRVVWDSARIRLSAIARLLDSLGYKAHPYRGGRADEARRRENRRQLIRIAAAGAIAANVMLISFALFAGMFDRMEPAYRELFRWSGLGLTLLALIWPGRVFFVGAVASLRARAAHMDLPVAVALTAGTFWGAANTLRGTGETYFESLTAVIFLLLVGRYLLFRRQYVAQDALEQLFNLTPRTARRIDGSELQEISLDALEPGMRVELRAGETVPADGVIVEGQSSFDLSLLTGESRPASHGPGERVFAATTNLTRRVVVEVETTGVRTRVGRLMALVESFARDRPPIVLFADRLARRFVVVVLGLALVTFVAWVRFDPQLALENAIALMIVTCPCALGLATPLAVTAAIGRAAGAGILIKGGEALERLARPGLLLLDKTGTLTHGRMHLACWTGDRDALRDVAAIEAHVAHPIAQAFVDARDGDVEPATARDVRHVPGCAVEGTSSGRSWVIGSPGFVATRATPPAEALARAEDEMTARGLTPVRIAADGTVVAVAGFGDTPRDDATRTLAALRRRGWSIGIISGDDPRIVRDVATRLGLDPSAAHGGMSPEAKAERVKRSAGNDRTVVMVGDGANDSAALTAAGVGIAVHGGAEVSLGAADVYLRRPGLDSLVRLVDGSRRTLGVIRLNVAVSLVYNVVTASLAIGGWINPLVAAVLMPLSSLTVLILSYRSRTFDSWG